MTICTSTRARTRCWASHAGMSRCSSAREGKGDCVKRGDVVVCRPARASAAPESRDLLVVGAYPKTGVYDEPRPAEVDRDTARATISHVPIPAKDPVYGKNGPLLAQWRG